MASLVVNGIAKLTRNAEVFKSKNAAYIHLGLAVFRKDPKEGRQDVDFFDAEYYYRNPETGMEKSLTKGKMIYLDRAELRNDRFTGFDGRERSKVKIVIYGFDFIGAVEEKKPKLIPSPPPLKKEEPKLEVLPEEPPF